MRTAPRTCTPMHTWGKAPPPPSPEEKRRERKRKKTCLSHAHLSSSAFFFLPPSCDGWGCLSDGGQDGWSDLSVLVSRRWERRREEERLFTMPPYMTMALACMPHTQTCPLPVMAVPYHVHALQHAGQGRGTGEDRFGFGLVLG